MRIDQPDPYKPDAPRPDGADPTDPADRTDPVDRGDHGADTDPSRERRGGPEAAVSREEQVAAHVRYRETVEAAFRAAADLSALSAPVSRDSTLTPA
jgi:hypothetical protein